ncbi:uncharacterized protein FOMMEDRAFT_85219 [Fomitiporia mediterranea MF3/22]|uniref:uncharacterized protein n=1 Tax=Fomitiporia mediterranea (strain MF3/22) TaxID=694068 RepID=UPI000440766C|nr:uncharacterized protein FOMMEDRAFT_85219 [Fomitiporia mediterranea MF3/22]EJD02919.1 hypothetical protein FOMMEDRAFT_85219 [Fomitiporia mediterranea MF3/22]
MPVLTKDQIRHEVINLQKTLKLLERTYDEEDWTRCSSKERNTKWLKAQSILTVRYFLTPLRYRCLADGGQQFYDETKSLLDRLERELLEINEDLKPRPHLPNPILPTLPRPSLLSQQADSAEDEKLRLAANEVLMHVDVSELNGQDTVPPSTLSMEPQISTEDEDFLPDTLPNKLSNPSTTLIPPALPSTSTSTDSTSRPAGSITGGPLQTSTALHEELSNQLAQMATQLRRNAEQFGEALASDEGVVKETQEKLERNYDEVSKERVRLRDHSAKSSGTTCFVFLAVIAVVTAFFMTFLVIRVT